MGDHSVQVVISGKGGQQIQLRWQGATSDRPMVLQVASLSTPAPPRLDRGEHPGGPGPKHDDIISLHSPCLVASASRDNGTENHPHPLEPPKRLR